KVPGYVASIEVKDNQFVRAGEVIARIDDGDYKLAADAARDKVATQRAAIDRIGRQIPVQQAAVEQARAQLVSAQAAATRAQSELDRQQALASKEFASKQTLEQALANRDLAFTVIRAPIDGVIGNRAIQIGDYLQPGQRLAALVPLRDVYVDANFKETQLAHIAPGQKVDVSVDALPGH